MVFSDILNFLFGNLIDIVFILGAVYGVYWFIMNWEKVEGKIFKQKFKTKGLKGGKKKI